MAKVSELKFDLSGKEYKVNVNCTSSGEFNANLPENVAEALRISTKLKSDTLIGLTTDFNDKLKHYKTLQTKEELYIIISYHARGKYTYKKDGSVLFGHMDKKHNIDISFSEITNAVGLDFLVAIKQTIDSKKKWFRASLGKDCSHIQKEYSEPNVYHKMEAVRKCVIERCKIIPFNQVALETLESAQEKLRTVSEILYNFISQDEENILSTLTNQKLLS